jgi:hypothetical protein
LILIVFLSDIGNFLLAESEEMDFLFKDSGDIVPRIFRKLVIIDKESTPGRFIDSRKQSV